MTRFNANELTFDNISEWPNAVKMGALLGLFLMIIGIGYELYLKEKFQNYAQLKTDTSRLKNELGLMQPSAMGLTASQHQAKVLKLQFEKMIKQTSTKHEMPGLLDSISKVGIKNGLTFELFEPLPETPHEFYLELPVKIMVIGDYHQFGVFLGQLAHMRVIVKSGVQHQAAFLSG